MFFRRKKWLRSEFDEKLLEQLNRLKTDWNNQKSLVEKSFDPSPEAISQAKLAEAKYFFYSGKLKREMLK
ncbi:YaaL family protein [Cytobacillus firmus]|uniref:YaaL family protein n=1 Tax=Cytobacillus firmus TaxID=1399 RepID=UPI003D20CC36